MQHPSKSLFQSKVTALFADHPALLCLPPVKLQHLVFHGFSFGGIAAERLNGFGVHRGMGFGIGGIQALGRCGARNVERRPCFRQWLGVLGV